MYYTVPYCAILYCTVLYCTIPYYTIPYNSIPSIYICICIYDKYARTLNPSSAPSLPRPLGLLVGCPTCRCVAHAVEGDRNLETLPLRVQRSQIRGIYGSYTRNRISGFGNILCIWVLRPLGDCLRGMFEYLCQKCSLSWDVRITYIECPGLGRVFRFVCLLVSCGWSTLDRQGQGC